MIPFFFNHMNSFLFALAYASLKYFSTFKIQDFVIISPDVNENTYKTE